MKAKNKIGIAGMIAAVAFTAGGNVEAAAVLPFYQLAETKVAKNGSFTMGEFTGEDGTVGYVFDVAPGFSVNAFAVSLVDPGFSLNLTTTNGWTSQSVSKANWATGNYGFAGVSGATLGSFESLFGNADNMAIIFTAPITSLTIPGAFINGQFFPGITTFTPGFMNDSNDSDFNSWQNGASQAAVPFRRLGVNATEVIAFDSGGALLGGSVIPEPSSAVLIALGAMGLLRRRR